jgi:hypothetical protein
MISSSLTATYVNAPLVYLLQAAGFDVMPLHSEQHLTIPREIDKEPIIPKGPEWTGPRPENSPLQKSYFAREELKSSVGENDPKYRMADLARRVYFGKILENLPKREPMENISKDASLQRLLGDETVAKQIEELGKIVAMPGDAIIALTDDQLRAIVEQIKESIPKPPNPGRKLSSEQKEQKRSWERLSEECDRIIESIPP